MIARDPEVGPAVANSTTPPPTGNGRCEEVVEMAT